MTNSPAKVPPKIHGQSLAAHARAVIADETARIETTMRFGFTAGDSNTDLAHRVIGSRRLNGANGATAITRQHIIRLGRGLLYNRKSRMSGA